MTSACFSRGHTGFSRNATLVATVNPPALAGGVFNFFVTFAKLLTIEAPLCWLATFTAKKAHQHHRVYEEYSHKYTAAMTYAGLCKETRDNPELYGKDSVKNLADGFRDAVYYNPSNEIDKKVELSSPLDIAESLVKSVGQQAAEVIVSKKGQNEKS